MKLLEMHDAAVQKELLLLATAPTVDSSDEAVLSEARLPRLFALFRRWLFVGFAHDLLLELMVSRLAMLEKRHTGTHALMLDA
eukprot:2239283-Pleurochrysis_carterae.AAC.1